MIEYETIKYKNIDEIMYKYSHKSGLDAFVIPKKGFTKKYAVFATHFGSINTQFVELGKGRGLKEITTVPDGIAHFLEHKLFDQEEGNVMDKFSALGSQPNAYTSFNQTVYLFSCTDNFNENFHLLLKFVQNPYFTHESIEKEKSIIKQEINMYRDNANWRAYFNFLNALYKNNNVKKEILGTPESVDTINRDALLKCYNSFYNLNNMVICVVGDVDKEDVFYQVDKNLKKELKSGNKILENESYNKSQDEMAVERIFPDEPLKPNKTYIQQNMQISTPVFQMGFKDKSPSNLGLELLKREIAVKILLEMIMGKSTNLHLSLYEKGLINSTFNFDYTAEENYAHSIISGESKEPDKVKEYILENISENLENLKKSRGLGNLSNLKEEDFLRVKNAKYGRSLRWFNSVETISGNFITSFFKGIYIFDYFDLYDKIDFNYTLNIMKEHFVMENFAMSVIMPS